MKLTVQMKVLLGLCLLSVISMMVATSTFEMSPLSAGARPRDRRELVESRELGTQVPGVCKSPGGRDFLTAGALHADFPADFGCMKGQDGLDVCMLPDAATRRFFGLNARSDRAALQSSQYSSKAFDFLKRNDSSQAWTLENAVACDRGKKDGDCVLWVRREALAFVAYKGAVPVRSVRESDAEYLAAVEARIGGDCGGSLKSSKVGKLEFEAVQSIMASVRSRVKDEGPYTQGTADAILAAQRNAAAKVPNKPKPQEDTEMSEKNAAATLQPSKSDDDDMPMEQVEHRARCSSSSAAVPRERVLTP